MHIDVNGTRLWFDVNGASLEPDGAGMRSRPTVVLVHGGPGSYDHSYLKPHFDLLGRYAQVIYLDLRDHGRSARHRAADWTLEICADDVRAFCDALGIVRPVVLGHSLGGVVAMLYGARHPDHAGALILQSTLARFDLPRLVDGFWAMAGGRVAELARRDYSGDVVNDAEWAEVFSAFGPTVPSGEQLARRLQNAEVGVVGMGRLRELDIVGELARIDCPTMVCVGDLDPVTPVPAAQEIRDALPAGLGRLEVIEAAGHFPWLDRPERWWPLLIDFVVAAPAP